MGRFKNFMGFIASVVTVSGFLYGAFLTIKNYLAGIQFLVPAWLSLLTMFISFIAGYFICLKFGHKFQFYKSISISFDYAPDSPSKHGWRIVAENNDRELPSFSSVKDGFYGNVLQISSTKRWYMDYAINYPQNKYRRVEFIINPTHSKQTLYVHVQMKSKFGTEMQNKWFCLTEPGSSVRDININEKCVPVRYNTKDGGWIGVEANIPSLMQMTYSKEGWVFEKVLCLRIRNTVRIASIELYH